jgi:hypothetical protein
MVMAPSGLQRLKPASCEGRIGAAGEVEARIYDGPA